MLNNIEINYCHVLVLEVKLNQYNLVKYVVETTLKLRPGLRPVHMTLYLPARTIVTLFQEFFTVPYYACLFTSQTFSLLNLTFYIGYCPCSWVAVCQPVLLYIIKRIHTRFFCVILPTGIWNEMYISCTFGRNVSRSELLHYPHEMLTYIHQYNNSQACNSFICQQLSF